MSEPNANRFRMEADECLRLAELAFSKVDREAWLRLAADWISLAEARPSRIGADFSRT